MANDDLLGLYANALALYYAPLDEDYGLATIEAMKSSKPVLTTSDSGGILEFVSDGVTGFVTPPTDPAALAQRIDELHASRHLVKEMGVAAEQLVAGITWDKAIDRLLED